MQTPLPLTRDLVLIGGGHAHALVLLKWAMDPLPGVRLTVINPEPTAPYTGMLPGHVAGHYGREELEIDLVKLGRHAGARLVMARATGIDRAARRVRIEGRPDIAYDVASVDVGITSVMPEIPGFTARAHAAKPLGPFAIAWEEHVARAARGAAGPDAAVIGGGVAGVELALAMAHRLKVATGGSGTVSLVEQGAAILPEIGRSARAALIRHLERLEVRVLTGAAAAEITQDGIRLADGRWVAAGFVTGAAGARPHGWLAETGFATEAGYLTVDATLKTSDPAIFAAGDCAHLAFAPRPKAGVFAVREAPILFHNLRAALSGGMPRRFRPQRDYLKLISTGGQGAVADKFRLRLDGPLLWRLKDRIDRKFMAMFKALPEMPPAPLPARVADGVRDLVEGAAPLCGGCGAKLGRDELGMALADLPGPMRADVLSGPGDDAAILKHGAGVQVFTTDTLRAFTDDPWLMARIAALHAMGDIWAMGAAPQAALAEITLPRLALRLAAETLREIMAAATETFRAAGADIVGGHTTTGSELAIGFSVTGLTGPQPVTLAGARAGDALILTAPLGVGTILAAEMRKAARGDWVAGAFASMTRGQGKAAAILAPVATAMTDVTGFGLAGHLLGMLEASGASAEIALADIPLLDGALTLSEAGIRSSLWPSNAAVAAQVTGASGARADLIYDPQTAGGLLAAVPMEEAADVLGALREAGYPAAQIGFVRPGVPGMRLI
jgi:selenide,water dikinase